MKDLNIFYTKEKGYDAFSSVKDFVKKTELTIGDIDFVEENDKYYHIGCRDETYIPSHDEYFDYTPGVWELTIKKSNGKVDIYLGMDFKVDQDNKVFGNSPFKPITPEQFLKDVEAL